jgi:Vacuolar sorting-associated protein 13, N-terminal/N-terminal region of Chorein or VPS13/Repeating coiled region of VPS13
MEDILGEYVLNIDKENLRIAALQGKIKLDNVQLDGDLIGSNILGAVGLSGFGVLSCWAKSVRIVIPLKNLEKEPTRFEMRGIHLVCLPLLPSTAHKIYGAGTAVDPKCTLRTRAKRSKLARYEGNFLSGRLDNEGPPTRRILRAVRSVERERKKNSQQQQQQHPKRRGSFTATKFAGESSSTTAASSSAGGGDDYYDDNNTYTLDSLVSDLGSDTGDQESMLTGDGGTMASSDDRTSNSNLNFNAAAAANINAADLPELPRDWKVKLREKMMRNMEASMQDVHIRCEVPENGLDFCHPDHHQTTPNKTNTTTNPPSTPRRKASSVGLDSNNNKEQEPTTQPPSSSSSTPSPPLKPDQRAFSFGVTLDSISMRTANEKWEVGCHEKTFETSNKDHLGPNPYDARDNKLISIENLSFYWDDDPPFLISETDVVKSSSSSSSSSSEQQQQQPTHKLSAEKIQSRITAAMEALYGQQEPGAKIREFMQGSNIGGRSNSTRSSMSDMPNNDNNNNITTTSTATPAGPDRAHQYCFEGFQSQVRLKLSNRTQPGPVSCLAEFLPFQLDAKYRPHQYVQYQKLKSAMLSQQRFDTMLRQRPYQNPIQNPRGWWKYAIGCVTTRPTSRPWHDVVRIAKSRNRYVQLVISKLSRSSHGSGFHSGLTEAESAELLVLEELLPIEALLAFHLIALRKYSQQGGGANIGEEVPSPAPQPTPDSTKNNGFASNASGSSKSPHRPSGMGLVRASKLTRIFRGSKSKSSSYTELAPKPPTTPTLNSYLSPLNTAFANNPPVPSIVTAMPSTPGSQLSLLEAMTVRLGRKPWYTNFKLDQVTLHVTLLSSTDVPIVKLVSETTGTARSYGGQGKIDFFYDVTKFEIRAEGQAAAFGGGSVVGMGGGFAGGPIGEGKILVVQAAEEDSQYYLDDQATIGDILDSFSSEFDAQAVTDFLELPPPGVVCRIAASKDPTSTKLSFSAHPATLVWTRTCFDALAEFFGAPSTEMQTELTLHLKNAATPLARKAQLALLSPSTLSLHVNVAAPKIWVPFSSNGTDGALFLDAGNLRTACTKDDGDIDMNWDIDASDIQVNFARGSLALNRLMTSPVPLFSAIEFPNHTVTSIVRPFHVRAVAGVRDWKGSNEPSTSSADRPNTSYCGPISCVDVTISPICLNLVDAEVLARAIGKWYAQGLLRVRGRVYSKRKHTRNSNGGLSSPQSRQESVRGADSNASSNSKAELRLSKIGSIDAETAALQPRTHSRPHSISVTVEKIEMALEGHSKLYFSDEKSIESHDYSLLEHAPSTRTYVVEVFKIAVRRSIHNSITATKFVVEDASIVQLKDAGAYSAMKERHEASEAQYAILERGNRQSFAEQLIWSPRARFHSDPSPRANSMGQNQNKNGTRSGPPRAEILTASLFHDGTAHLDEVEIDIDSIILRVTPTSLKDCVKATRKIIELVQLMTREMERKVHEEGRKARQRGRDGKFQWQVDV